MNQLKKNFFLVTTLLMAVFLITSVSRAEDNNNTNVNGNNNNNGNSNINTNTNIAPLIFNSNLAIQVASGSVDVQGTQNINLGNDNVNWKDNWKGEAFGDYSQNISFELQGNTIFLRGKSAYGYDVIVSLTFDDYGNLIKYEDLGAKDIFTHKGALEGFCVGDDPACKVSNYSQIKLQTLRTLFCSFNCDQKNNYNYSLVYQVKRDSQYSTINADKAYKCEEIKSVFTPNSEWFGFLTHSCSYRGSGREGIYTIDTISPPTNLSACSDQASCLATGTEYSLTPTTFGKGVQKVSADFISSAQNSLNSGTDATVKCTSGLCTPYTSGSHKLSVTIPETSYLGQCRGTAQDETVEGKTIASPEVSINTDESKIPGGISILDFNVLNRAPLVSVSLSNNNPAVNEEVMATCDIIDPDTCSDKITKVTWACLNDQKQKVSCYFGQDGIWHEGTITKEIPEAEQSDQYRSIVKFKAGTKGMYAVTCEATDNDLTSSATGVGGAGVSVEGGEVAEMMKYCAVLSEEGGTNKTVCGDTAKVNLKTYQFGIDAGKYEWKCKNTDTFTSGAATKECAYSEGGTFVPGLRIFDNKSSSWIDCTSDNNTVKVANKAKCSVLVRPVGSTDDYKTEANITSGDQIEAKIERECTKDSDKTIWTTDGTKVSETDTKAFIKYLSGGIGSVKANIGGTTCTGASVNISDKVKMGN